MINKLLMLSFLLTICFSIESNASESNLSKTSSASYFEGRIDKIDKRYSTMKRALELMNERNAEVIVETGTARNGTKNFLWDGGSTIIFADWARDRNSIFYSVDISPDAIREAEQAIGSNSNVNFVCEDSVKFLNDFDKPIDFLYLDSFDFDFNDPYPSQEHHLKEIIAAYSHLTRQSFVMIDDCDLPHGGKGKLAIEFLLGQGWTILEKGYQVILTQE